MKVNSLEIILKQIEAEFGCTIAWQNTLNDFNSVLGRLNAAVNEDEYQIEEMVLLELLPQFNSLTTIIETIVSDLQPPCDTKSLTDSISNHISELYSELNNIQ